MEKKKYFVGRIYLLENTVDNETYVGSTSKTLEHRLMIHKKDSRKLSKNSKLYIHMRNIGENCWFMKHLRFCIVNSISELHKIEQRFQLIEKPTLNSNSSHGHNLGCLERKKAYKHQYHLANKDVINQRHCQWKMKNKDKISEYERKYRSENKEKIAQRQRDYRAKKKLEKLIK